MFHEKTRDDLTFASQTVRDIQGGLEYLQEHQQEKFNDRIDAIQEKIESLKSELDELHDDVDAIHWRESIIRMNKLGGMTAESIASATRHEIATIREILDSATESEIADAIANDE